MVVIKRSWTKNSQVSNSTEFLDIWDSGSHRYERWPDGTEVYWKIISKSLTESGFEEVLEKMPVWLTPSQVIHQERLPLELVLEDDYRLGAWQVKELVLEGTVAYMNKKVHSENSVEKRLSGPQVNGRPGQKAPQRGRGRQQEPRKGQVQMKP